MTYAKPGRLLIEGDPTGGHINVIHRKMEVTTRLHEWETLVVVTDQRTADPNMLVERLTLEALRARRDTVMLGRLRVLHIHIGENSTWDDHGMKLTFPLQCLKCIEVGCLDPRLVNGRANRPPKKRKPIFSYPAVLLDLVQGNEEESRWLVENLSHAVAHYGTRKIVIQAHEDCKAHPVPGEQENLHVGMKARQEVSEKAIQILSKVPSLRNVRFSLGYETLDGVRLAVRRQRLGLQDEQLIVSGLPMSGMESAPH
jgi:hypothetical protein